MEVMAIAANSVHNFRWVGRENLLSAAACSRERPHGPLSLSLAVLPLNVSFSAELRRCGTAAVEEALHAVVTGRTREVIDAQLPQEHDW